MWVTEETRRARERVTLSGLRLASDVCRSQLRGLHCVMSTLSSDGDWLTMAGSRCIRADVAERAACAPILQLMVARSCIRKMLSDAELVCWLARHYPEGLALLQATADIPGARYSSGLPATGIAVGRTA